MTSPTVVDIPHTLGREEARRRVRARIGELPGHIPGGMAEVRSSWTGEDSMALEVKAMGQTLSGTLDIEDRVIRVTMLLPPLLSMMSGVLAAAVKTQGSQLLLGD